MYSTRPLARGSDELSGDAFHSCRPVSTRIAVSVPVMGGRCRHELQHGIQCLDRSDLRGMELQWHRIGSPAQRPGTCDLDAHAQIFAASLSSDAFETIERLTVQCLVKADKIVTGSPAGTMP